MEQLTHRTNVNIEIQKCNHKAISTEICKNDYEIETLLEQIKFDFRVVDYKLDINRTDFVFSEELPLMSRF